MQTNPPLRLLDRTIYITLSETRQQKIIDFIESQGYSLSETREMAWEPASESGDPESGILTLITLDLLPPSEQSRSRYGNLFKIVTRNGQPEVSTTLTKIAMREPPDWWPRQRTPGQI